MCELCLSQGCSLTAKTSSGNTPWDLACDHADLEFNKWISTLEGAKAYYKYSTCTRTLTSLNHRIFFTRNAIGVIHRSMLNAVDGDEVFHFYMDKLKGEIFKGDEKGFQNAINQRDYTDLDTPLMQVTN